jgi:cell division protein FtsX
MMNSKKTCSNRDPNPLRDGHTTMEKKKATTPILQIIQISISLALFCVFVFFWAQIREASVDWSDTMESSRPKIV